LLELERPELDEIPLHLSITEPVYQMLIDAARVLGVKAGAWIV
jgi:hypothetical protein